MHHLVFSKLNNPVFPTTVCFLTAYACVIFAGSFQVQLVFLGVGASWGSGDRVCLPCYQVIRTGVGPGQGASLESRGIPGSDQSSHLLSSP